MPLPKPPATRAAILPASAYETQAAPKSARHAPQAGVAGATSAEDDSPHLALRNDSATTLAAPPVVAKAKGPAAAAPLRRPAPEPKPRKPRSSGPAKLYVLDTNVLMHDPMSLFRFEEHDIFLPMIVLEELDGHKKGTTEVARNARQASRTLDALAGAQGADIASGLKLNTTGHPEAGGSLFFQTQTLVNHLPISLPQ